MKYITSDLHFRHKNILKFNPKTRPFDDISHMEDELVYEINSLDNCEMLYHLGDFIFGSPRQLSRLLDRIHVPMTFIRGNHDEKRCWEVIKEWSNGRAYDYREIRHQGHKVVLFHFPIAHWNQKEKGAIHLFGHCHGSYLTRNKSIDVGYDSFGHILTLDNAIEIADVGEIDGRVR